MIELDLQNASSRYLKLCDGILDSEEILLIQCDAETDAASIARSGAKLKSKGGASDAVHLCLEDKTLACKYVETTNSLFLVDVAEAQEDIENWPAECRGSGAVRMSPHAGLLSQLHSDLQAEFAPPIQMQARSNFIVETARCSVPVPQVQRLLQQHCIDRATVDGQNVGRVTMSWAELSSSVMASDQDITAALQLIKGIWWQSDVGDGWSLLDELLLLDALEHILLTCVEHSLPLEKFQMSGLLSALQAEDTPLACEPCVTLYQYALTLNSSKHHLRHVLQCIKAGNRCKCLGMGQSRTCPGNPVVVCGLSLLRMYYGNSHTLHCISRVHPQTRALQSAMFRRNWDMGKASCIEEMLASQDENEAAMIPRRPFECLCRNAIILNDSCLAWHVVRRYGMGSLAFAAWDPETNTARPEFPAAALHMGFDVQEVARGCMHAVLSRYCERIHGDPGTGKTVVNIDDIQDDWKDVFPGPQFWNECACMNEQEKILWSRNLMLEACQGLALRQVVDEAVELRVLFETCLSPSAKERFEILFSVKDTWTRDEIEPYLNLQDGECCGSTELLLRYSRIIRDGTAVAPVYCAR